MSGGCAEFRGTGLVLVDADEDFAAAWGAPLGMPASESWVDHPAYEEARAAMRRALACDAVVVLETDIARLVIVPTRPEPGVVAWVHPKASAPVPTPLAARRRRDPAGLPRSSRDAVASR